MALKRLQKEYKELLKNPLSMSKVCLTEDPLIWKAYITGPTDTPYEGERFELELQLSEDYPYKTSYVKFMTKIFDTNTDTH
jgi:ubiquitin-protein ligase